MPEMSAEEVKANFIKAYDADLESCGVQLACCIAQNGTLVHELVEAEAALNLSACRYWDVLKTECSEQFLTQFKAQLAGDTNSEFVPKLRFFLEVLKVYDEITLELEPSRQGSIAISELRERLDVAHMAMNLQLRIFTNPVDELQEWSSIWMEHLKVQNKRPNAEFVLNQDSIQQLLAATRDNTVSAPITAVFERLFDLGNNPTSQLIGLAQKLRGSLPACLGQVLDRAVVLNRIKTVVGDSQSIGKVLGPCEITAIKAESAKLKGYESLPGVQESITSLHSIWKTSFDGWHATSNLKDFQQLHDDFQQVHAALVSGDISKQPWLEKPKPEEMQAKIKRYQDCLLRALPIKVAASAMLQHMVDATTSEKLEAALKDAAAIVNQSGKVELVLASVVVATVLLEKPRPKDFKSQYSSAMHFSTTICKIKTDKLPDMVQTLMKAEAATDSAAQAQSASKKKSALESMSNASTAASSASASSAAAASTVSVADPKGSIEAESETQTKPRKKAKLA
jgi:hypothetical protein